MTNVNLVAGQNAKKVVQEFVLQPEKIQPEQLLIIVVLVVEDVRRLVLMIVLLVVLNLVLVPLIQLN